MYFSDSQFSSALHYIGQSGSENSFLILLAENSQIKADDLVKTLNQHQIVFFGGIFPKVIHGTRIEDSGFIVTPLKMSIKPILLKKDDAYLQKILLPIKEQGQLNGKSAIVLTDGLSPNTSYFLNQLFDQLDSRLNYFGGGAGSITLKPQPCIFCNDGVFQDCAILGLADLELELGIQHGWQKVAGPCVVTKAQGNVIQELNWENPLIEYNDQLNSINGPQVTQKLFYPEAKRYPFGLLKEGSEDIVRDPVAVNEEGHLICVGDIESNSVVNILSGNKNSLINSAEKAVKESLKSKTVGTCLIADCVSRALFLEDDFIDELETINDAIHDLDREVIPEGALTLGEISSYGDGYIEFFNKTIVIANFHGQNKNS